MADLMIPDLAGSYMRGNSFGTQQRIQREGEQRQSRLAALAQQAYGAAPDQREGLIGQAVGIDPDAGLAMSKGLRGEDDAREQALLNTARMIDGAPPEMKESLYQQVRPRIGQYLPNLPDAYNDQVGQGIKAFIASRSTGGGNNVQSRFVGEDGQIYALMRDGSVQPLGIKADPRTQIVQGDGGFYGIDQRNLQASPVQLGRPGVQQAPTRETPFSVDPSLPPEVQADIRATEARGQEWTQAPTVGGGQLQPARKPAATPSGYRYAADGALEPIPGGPAQVAIDARADAAAARKAAEEAKAAAKKRDADARQAASMESANQLVSAIDSLMESEGFNELGTAWGDVQQAIPLVRNDAKDANAQLKNIAGQVALATMARLKALSSQGATGFGALSAPELRLLENSIATLQSEDISNAQLRQSLKTIRDTMDKVANWGGEQQGGGGYQVGQVIEAGGRRYRVTGGDPNDPDVEEVL